LGEDRAEVADIEALVGLFLDRTLPKAEWTHQAHLVVGAWHVEHFGVDGAIERLRAGIRSLNDAHGTINSATGGYHETITCAYAHLIALFFDVCPAGSSLLERVSILIAGPFGERDLLLRFYGRDLLMSARARAEWVEPDIAPLRLPQP
jgi:hypothetical protein